MAEAPASEREDEELQRRRHSLRLLGRLDQHRPSLGRFFAPYGVDAPAFDVYRDTAGPCVSCTPYSCHRDNFAGDSRLTGPEDRTMSDSYEFATHRPDACPCSAASARYVATCAPMAGRSATMGLDAIRGPQAGGVRRPPSPLRPAAASWCQGGAPCVLTRWCVARGGGARRCADRSCRSGGTGAASPVRGAPDRRPTGPRHRAVPARE